MSEQSTSSDQPRLDLEHTVSGIAPAGVDVAEPRGLNSTAANRRPQELDLQVLARQLGRPVRDVVEIPARCACGNPLVAATAPRLSGGTPFPTVYYLSLIHI